MNIDILVEEYMKKASEAQKNNKELKALNLYLKANELTKGEDIEILINLALIYHKEDMIEVALDYYNQIISLNEDEERAYYGIAVIYDEREEYQEAIWHYKKALYINPNYLKAYFFLANVYDVLGEKENAIEYYEKLLSLYEDDFFGNINLGSIYEELDNDTAAYKKFAKALEIDKDHYLALFNMGVINNKFKNREKAMEFYKRAINKNPGYPYSFLNLAVLYKENNIEKGIDILSLGIKYNPNCHFLYYNRGCFYGVLNDDKKGFEDIKKALEIYPDFMKYILEDDELQNIVKMKEFKDIKNR